MVLESMVFDAFLGLSNVKGLEGLGSINFLGFFSGLGKVLGAVIIFLIIGGITFFFLKKKKEATLDNKKIFWFEEVNTQTIPVDEDLARELTIPGTNITIFYIKKKDLYLPRLTKRMGKDAYWLGIKNNREIINFVMKGINPQTGETDIDYDHTDMRYALTNLFEMIKRNYRDKATPWWKEYKEVISIVIYIFVMSLAFFFLLGKVASLLDKIGILIDHADKLVQSASTINPNSGVIIK